VLDPDEALDMQHWQRLDRVHQKISAMDDTC